MYLLGMSTFMHEFPLSHKTSPDILIKLKIEVVITLDEQH